MEPLKQQKGCKIEDVQDIKYSLCQGCLSYDRTLEPLGNYADVFKKICDIFVPVNEFQLCWECIAFLRRTLTFREKVKNAQRILSSPSYAEIKVNPLSTLVADHSKSNGEIAMVYEPKNVTPDAIITANEEKPVEVKIELDMPDADINEYSVDDYIDYFDDDYKSLLDLKVLNKIEGKIKHEKKKFKSVHKNPRPYKMIVDSSKFMIELVSQVRIKPDDLNTWKSNEKDSSYFKNLKEKCEKCICYLDTSLEEHNALQHDKSAGPYWCSICDVYFATDRALIQHNTNHYMIYRCDSCGYRCLTHGHMKDHVTAHKKTVKCLLCGASFSNVRRFYNHYKHMHSMFICDHCNKKCTSKSILERHMKHHGVHKCEMCDVTFKELRSLVYHKKLIHTRNGGEEAFCVRCDIQFANVQLFKRHLNNSVAHADERRTERKRNKVQCPQCDKVYSRNYYMMNHYRHVHMKQTKYYCADCDKFYLNRTRFLEHRKYSHEGQLKKKDKLCTVCGRGFSDNRILENHMRTHSGERPFECSYCNAKFTQKQAMLSHVKFIHLKSKRKTVSFN